MGKGRMLTGEEQESLAGFSCAAGGCALFFGLIFFSAAFSLLGPSEMGLRYNAKILQIEKDRLYGGAPGQGGRFYLGFRHSFIKFPRELVHIYMTDDEVPSDVVPDSTTVLTRTSDGLPVAVDVHISYRHLRNATLLQDLYMQCMKECHKILTKIARHAIRDAASDFEVWDYFFKRREVGEAMKKEVGKHFEPFHVVVETFFILDIDIGRELQDAITETAVADQRIGEALFALEAERVRQSTRILEARQDAIALVVQANGTAETVLIDKKAYESVQFQRSTAASVGYNITKNTFDFDSKELLNHIWIELLREKSAGSIINLATPNTIQQIANSANE